MDIEDFKMIAPSMTTLRTTLVCASFLLTFFILAWMLSEQDKVKICVERTDSPPRVVEVNQSSEWDSNWDKRAPKNGGDLQGVPVRTIILVRHGQYEMTTGKLTELGERQANLTGWRLKQMYPEYNAIVHSTMIRARQTAGHIHNHLPNVPMSEDDLLKEGAPVPPQPPISYWGLPEQAYFVDGPRIEAAFRKHFYRHESPQTKQTRTILVGHGNIFRYLILRVLQFPSDAWMRFFIAHASITVVHIYPDGNIAMDKIGDGGHLPVTMNTY